MTPFLTEPIIGLREWWIDDERMDTLASIPSRSVTWPAGRALSAECRCHVRHRSVPSPRGKCGLYAVALDTVRHLEPGYAGHVSCDARVFYPEPWYPIGLVALWGRVLLGQRGVYRAQHAYPVALFEPAPRSKPPHLERVADAYGVPVLRLPRTPAALLEVAEWVRRQFRPVAVPVLIGAAADAAPGEVS